MTANSATKVLVVFYSRTGATSAIANAIARRCGADIEELRDVRARDGISGYLRSALEAIRKTPAEIRPFEKKWHSYDVIVVGTPVWAGHVASPVRSYLAQQSDKAKRVAFFCTMGGRGAEGVFAEMSQLTRMIPAATIALTDREIMQRSYDDRLVEFMKNVVATDAVPNETAAERPPLAAVR